MSDKRKWISIADRTPKEGAVVFVVLPSSGNHIASAWYGFIEGAELYDDKSADITFGHSGVYFYDHRGWDGIPSILNVSHWCERYLDTAPPFIEGAK